MVGVRSGEGGVALPRAVHPLFGGDDGVFRPVRHAVPATGIVLGIGRDEKAALNLDGVGHELGGKSFLVEVKGAVVVFSQRLVDAGRELLDTADV